VVLLLIFLAKEKSMSVLNSSKSKGWPKAELLGLMVGILYWFIDSGINALVSSEGGFWKSLFAPNEIQLWIRISAVASMVFVSFLIRKTFDRRRRYHESLIESEDRLQKMMAVSTGPIIIHNNDTIIDANRAIAELLGYELNDIIGKSPYSFLDEASRKIAADKVSKDFEEPYQVTALTCEGASIKIEVRAKTTHLHGQKVRVAAIQNISGQTMPVQEAAPAESDKYRRLLLNGNDPLFVYGLTNENRPDNFIEVNEMASVKLGYSRKEFEKLNLLDIIAPEDRDNILPIVQTLIDFKHSIYETELLIRDGNRLPVEISSHLTDLDNRPIIISTLRETTERKKAEQLLRNREKQFRELFQHAPAAYQSLDKEGNIIEVNDKWCELTGYSKAEAVDSWFGDYLSRASMDRFRAALVDLNNPIESGERNEIELEIIGKNEKSLVVRMRLTALRNKSKEVRLINCLLQDMSDQRGIEQNKSVYDEWLKNIINSTDNIIFTFKPDGTIIDVNPAFQRVTGFSREAFIESNFGSLVHPDDLVFVKRTFEKCAEGEIIPPLELRLVTQSDKYMPIELKLDLDNFEKNSIRINAIASDLSRNWQQSESKAMTDEISNLKKTEQALQESFLSYLTLAENLPAMVYRVLCRAGNRMLFFNEQLEKITGYKEEELLVGEICSIETFIHPDDKPKVMSIIRNAIVTKEPFEAEYRFTHKSGEIKYFIERGRPIFDSEGELISVDGVIFDITERKQAEEAIRGSEEKYSAIFNEARDGIVLFDARTGQITDCNAEFENQTGRNIEQLRQMKIWEIRPPDQMKRAEEAFRNMSENGPVRSRGLDFQKPNGETVQIEFSSKKIEINGVEYIQSICRDITELYRAENDLKNQVNRNKTILETIPDIIMEINEHKVYTWANNSGFNFFGDDVIGKEASFYFEGAQNTYSVVQSLFNGNDDVIYVESWQRRKDGEKRLLAWWCKVIKDSGGVVRGALSSARDITEQEQLNDMANQQRDFAIAIGEAVHFEDILQLCMKFAINIGKMDCGGIYLINQATGNLELVCHQGLSDEFVKASSCYDSNSDNLQLVMAGKPVYSMHTELSLKLDSAKIGEGLHALAIIPIRHNAQVIGCLNIASHAIDGISDRARLVIETIAGQIGDAIAVAKAKKALMESEEKFRSIVELSVDGISLVDEKCRLIEWNRGNEVITGLKREDVLGQPIYDIQHRLVVSEKRDDKTYEMLKSSMESIMASGQSPYLNRFIDKVLERSDGTRRTVEMISFPIKSEKGFMICAITRDNTDKRLLQNELARAERLESIGVLAGGIAHDFNNILTAILGNISLARMDTVPGDEINARLAEAEKASERAQDLTRQLLTFSKGGSPIKKTICLREIIKESAGFALRGSQVKAKLNLPDELSPVCVDAGQISQVLNNLIINANQAMPDGGIIEITAENISITKENQVSIKDGKYLKITIHDEGTGIPADYLKRIFDPYFTTKQKGSGLGLATSYSIVKNHDGHIDVESRQGEGTSFYIYLPISNQPIEESSIDDERTFVDAGKILIMDDEVSIRMVTGVALTRLGYKTEFAADGAEAVEKYRQAIIDKQPFDLILMDLTIPGGISGKEAFDKIREIDANARVIVSSGYSNNPIMAEYEKYGFRGVIVKPYKAGDLGRTVYRVLHEEKVPV